MGIGGVGGQKGEIYVEDIQTDTAVSASSTAAISDTTGQAKGIKSTGAPPLGGPVELPPPVEMGEQELLPPTELHEYREATSPFSETAREVGEFVVKLFGDRTPEEQGVLAKKLLFALAHPELAGEFDGEVAALKEKLEKEGFSPPDGFSQSYDASMPAAFSAAYDDALSGADSAIYKAVEKYAEETGQSVETVVQKLQYALRYPDSEWAKELGSLTDTVAAHVQKEGGFVALPTIQGKAFQNALSVKIDSQIQAQLLDQFGSEGQAAITAYFTPELSSNPTLVAQVQAVAKEVRAELATQGLAPTGFARADTSVAYREQLQSAYLFQLYLNQADNPDLSEEELAALTKGQIIAEYGLKASFEPTSSVADVGKLTPTQQTSAETVSNMTFMLERAEAYINAMAPSPERDILLNFLKIISEAINALREVLHNTQSGDTEQSRDLIAYKTEVNKEKFDELKKKLEAYQKELEEAKEKEKKMGPFNAVIKPLSYVMTAAMGMIAGPVGLLIAAVLIASMIAEEVTKKPGFVNAAFKGIDEAIKEGVKDPALAATLSFATKSAVCAAVGYAGAGPMLTLQVFFQNASAVTDLVKDLHVAANTSDGMSAEEKQEVEMEGQKIGMYTSMAMQIAIIVVLISVALSAAAKGAASTTAAAGTSGDAAVKAATAEIKKSSDVVMRALLQSSRASWKAMQAAMEKATLALQRMAVAPGVSRAAQTGIENTIILTRGLARIAKFMDANSFKVAYGAVAAGVGLAQAGAQIGKNIHEMAMYQSLADASIKKGEADAWLAKIEGLIKLFQQLLDKILNSTAGFAEELAGINEMGNQFFAKQSEAAEVITSV